MLKPKNPVPNATTTATIEPEDQENKPIRRFNLKRKLTKLDAIDRTKNDVIDRLKVQMRELESQSEDNERTRGLTNVYRTLSQLDSEEKELNALEHQMYQNKRRKKELKMQMRANDKNKEFLRVNRLAFKKIAGVLGRNSFSGFYLVDPVTRTFRLSLSYEEACRGATNLVHRYEPKVGNERLSKIEEYYHLIGVFFIRFTMNDPQRSRSQSTDGSNSTDLSRLNVAQEVQGTNSKFRLNLLEREKEKYLFHILVQLNNNEEDVAMKLLAGPGCGHC